MCNIVARKKNGTEETKRGNKKMIPPAVRR
jgi:hypothetical protein